MVRPSRAAAVEDGPVLGPPEGFVLDGLEHGGRLARAEIGGVRIATIRAASVADRRDGRRSAHA